MNARQRHGAGWGAPQRYSSEQPFWHWEMTRRIVTNVVWMNNAQEVARFATPDEASRDAARRNYREGCYTLPEMIGL